MSLETPITKFVSHRIPSRKHSAGSRSKNSATNQKRAYGVGTDLVRTGYARIRPAILWGRTHDVRSGYGLKGGGMKILV